MQVWTLQEELVGAWRLPAVPAAWHLASQWGWYGTQLCVPFEGKGPVSEAGVLVLDMQRSEWHVISLQLWAPDPSEPVDGMEVCFCPREALMLVQLHQHQGFGPAEHFLMIFSFEGVLLAKGWYGIQGIEGMHELQCQWAASGGALTLHGVSRRQTGLWIGFWRFSETRVIQLPCPMAWLTPSPRHLAIGVQGHVMMIDLQGGGEQTLVPVEGARCIGWGSRLAVLQRLGVPGARLKTAGQLGCPKLLLYSTQDGAWALQHTVTAGGKLFSSRILEVSGDGELCAAVTGFPRRGTLHYRCLAVVHMPTGRLPEYSLLDAQLADLLPYEDLRVRWRPNSSAVLVSAKDGSHNLVRFA